MNVIDRRFARMGETLPASRPDPHRQVTRYTDSAIESRPNRHHALEARHVSFPLLGRLGQQPFNSEASSGSTGQRTQTEKHPDPDQHPDPVEVELQRVAIGNGVKGFRPMICFKNAPNRSTCNEWARRSTPNQRSEPPTSPSLQNRP